MMRPRRANMSIKHLAYRAYKSGCLRLCGCLDGQTSPHISMEDIFPPSEPFLQRKTDHIPVYAIIQHRNDDNHVSLVIVLRQMTYLFSTFA